MKTPQAPSVLHASAVAVGDRCALLLGASGSGKSALALHLLALGATLIADDRTCLGRKGDGVIAWSPPAILGLIEARKIGLLRVDWARPARVVLAVDLDRAETDRLPTGRDIEMLGRPVPLLAGRDVPSLAPVVMALLAGAELTET